MTLEICLLIPTVLWTDGRFTSVSYWMYMVLEKMLGRQKCIQLNHYYYLNVILLRVTVLLKIARYWSNSSMNRSKQEVIIHYEIHELINSIWNKEKLLQQWKERLSNIIITTDIFIKVVHLILWQSFLHSSLSSCKHSSWICKGYSLPCFVYHSSFGLTNDIYLLSLLWCSQWNLIAVHA